VRYKETWKNTTWYQTNKNSEACKTLSFQEKLLWTANTLDGNMTRSGGNEKEKQKKYRKGNGKKRKKQIPNKKLGVPLGRGHHSA